MQAGLQGRLGKVTSLGQRLKGCEAALEKNTPVQLRKFLLLRHKIGEAKHFNCDILMARLFILSLKAAQFYLGASKSPVNPSFQSCEC